MYDDFEKKKQFTSFKGILYCFSWLRIIIFAYYVYFSLSQRKIR